MQFHNAPVNVVFGIGGLFVVIDSSQYFLEHIKLLAAPFFLTVVEGNVVSKYENIIDINLRIKLFVYFSIGFIEDFVF